MEKNSSYCVLFIKCQPENLLNLKAYTFNFAFGITDFF